MLNLATTCMMAAFSERSLARRPHAECDIVKIFGQLLFGYVDHWGGSCPEHFAVLRYPLNLGPVQRLNVTGYIDLKALWEEFGL